MIPSFGGPLVSVIVPVFNGEEFILQSIDSALQQTWQNIEIIVVDDGSTDRTLSLLRKRAAQDARLHVLTQENGGVASARNRALAAARGTMIAPLDADDLWDPFKIERQVRRMLEGDDSTGMVYTGWVWIDAAGVVVDRSPRWMIEGSVFNELLTINFTGNSSVPLFRRSALEEVGGYNPELARRGAGGCEDWDIALRIARRFRVLAVPDALVGYRRRSGSMSTSLGSMWRSRELVVEALQHGETPIPNTVLRASRQQYSLYLAGVAFWGGSFVRALFWTIRAGVRLPRAVLPYVCRMLFARLRPAHALPTQKMRPGVHLNPALLPNPHIDYARIYRNLAGQAPEGG